MPHKLSQLVLFCSISEFFSEFLVLGPFSILHKLALNAFIYIINIFIILIFQCQILTIRTGVK